MFEFKIKNKDSYARNWVFNTTHWKISTPVFMPVWTKATVKGISKEELDNIWAEIILNNTYHLYLRPWDEIIKQLWWLHKFQNYNKPILTDSWWFQVFSLWNKINWKSLIKITEDWVFFRSFIDWTKHFFNAEKVMDIEYNLWADIIMAFDECASWDSPKQYAKEAMIRTHNWAERSIKKRKKNEKLRKSKWLYPQALFPIVQWVVYDDLRLESAKFIQDLNLPWIAIWWLSVWESKKDMYRILDIMKENLPENKPRYLMWVWTPEDIVEWIYRWIDMFDCVLPTRLWRHGVSFWNYGNIRIKNEKYKLSDEALDRFCECKVCKNYSRWYLRHLIQENEMLWMQLLSHHNLYFLVDITNKSKKAIEKWEFGSFRKEFLKTQNTKT